MDPFNDAPLLLKEWLVKVDPHTSTPYLIKFHASPADCTVMITDTKRTWVEVLSTRQLARRWRQCNARPASPLDDDHEDAWRTRTLDFISHAHTLGGIVDLSFEVVNSKFGDVAFQLESNAFKWRWDTVFVGHNASADILSRHLIMPLISLNHLAFSSPLADLSPTDLEMAIDEVARTARRTLDTHVKNALSKPRLATSIRRITALFNFISPSPSITTEIDVPILIPPPEPSPSIRPQCTPMPDHNHLTINAKPDTQASPRRLSPTADSGSATEPEDEDLAAEPPTAPGSSTADPQPDIRMRSPTPAKNPRSQPDTDSSPVRPIKKSKPRPPSSDEDSEAERRQRAAQIRRGTGSAAPGLRQPVKRGGKRF